MNNFRIALLFWVAMGLSWSALLQANEDNTESPAKAVIAEAAKAGNKKKFEQAAADFMRACKLDSANTIAHRGLAIAKDAAAGAIHKDAAKAFFQAIEEHTKGKPDKAIKALQKGFKKEKTYLPAHYLLGFFQEDMQKTDDALATYAGIISIAPGEIAAYRKRAELLERKSDTKAAIAAYSDLLKLQPENARALAARGKLYEQAGDQARAFADFDAALNLQNDAELAYHVGEVLLRQEKFSEAIPYFDKHLAVDTASVFGYLNRGVAYYEKGKYPRAIDDFYDALERNPQFTDAFYYRGLAYAELRLYEEAVADFNHVIDIDSGYVRAYYQRGRVQHERGRRKSAIADYDRALTLDPGFANAAYYKALAYDEMQQNAAAIRAFQSYLALVKGSSSEQARYAEKRIRALR